MSEFVTVQFEIKDMAIMKETLKELSHNFTELGEQHLQINLKYNVDIHSGTIKYDSDDIKEVNKLKKTYMVNFYRIQAIKEGMEVNVEEQANGEIFIDLIQR